MQQLRLGPEVVKSINAGDDSAEGRRHGWRQGVGVVHPAVHQVMVERSMEGAAGRGGGATDGDPMAPSSSLGHLQAFGFQPRPDFGQIAGAGAETLAKLLGCQKLAVIWRAGSVQPIEKGVERRVRPQDYRNPVERHGGIYRATVETRLGLQGRPARQYRGAVRIDGAGDAVRGRTQCNRRQ